MNEKKLIVVLFISTLAVLIAPESEMPVYLFIGQSNMLGYKSYSSGLSENKMVHPATKVFRAGRWQLYTPENQFGPELSAVVMLSRSKEAGLIKLAVSSTSLLAWSLNWSEEKAALTDNQKSGFLYKKLLGIVSKAGKSKKIDIRAIFLMQGETDAKYEIAASQYKKNLIELIVALRRDLNRPGLPFILGRIDPPSSCCPYRDVVRKAQFDVAGELTSVVMVSIDDLSRQADQLHLDKNGHLDLGRRFAEAYLKLEHLK